MTVQYNGEAACYAGVGSADAMLLLGIPSENGARVEIVDNTEQVYTDTYGPYVPFDEQHFLQHAIIRVELVNYVEAVLVDMRGRAFLAGGDAGSTEGRQADAGLLWGAGSKYFRFYIASPALAIPYNFPKTRLLDAIPFNMGTRVTRWNLVLKAVPYSGATGRVSQNSGAILYNRSTTGIP